jgi:hypothetical protein
MFRVITLIGAWGAPDWVKRYWVEKVFRHWSILIIETRTTVGFRRGNVILQKDCQRSAPSMRAAIHTGGDGGQTGDEDDDEVADVLPEIDDHGGDPDGDAPRQPPVVDTRCVHHKVHPLVGKPPGIEDQKPYGGGYDRGDNRRCVIGHLKKLPGLGYVHYKGGEHKAQHQNGKEGSQSENKSGLNGIPEVRRGKEIFIVSQTDEGRLFQGEKVLFKKARIEGHKDGIETEYREKKDGRGDEYDSPAGQLSLDFTRCCGFSHNRYS